MSEEKKRWLRPKELMEEYGFTLSWQSRERMTRALGLPFVKVGQKIFYDRVEIDRFLEARRVGG